MKMHGPKKQKKNYELH